MMENNDITALLYGLKENIRRVEGGDVSKALLDEVRSDFLNLVGLIKLFLISERDSYYGYILMNMRVSADFFMNSIAGIRLNEFPPVFESNPLLLCKFTLKEIMYIVCHEIDHIVLNHPTEMVKANPNGDQEIFQKFNMAADAAVNDRLDREIVIEKRQFLSRPEGVITSQTLSQMFHLGQIQAVESYAYYFSLIANKSSEEVPKNGQQSMMEQQIKNGSKDAVTDSGVKGASDADAGVGEEPQNRDEREIVTAANCGGNISDHSWNPDSNEEDVAAAVNELLNSAVDMMNAETRGLMPAHFMCQVELVNKPPVLSWQTILKKYVGTISAHKRKTRIRLNRRQPERFDLSGRMDDKVLKIVVAIDTSGSVSDRMIGDIMNEIFAILAKRKHEITVIECDAVVQRVYRARTPADIQTKVEGRGGTAFSPVIEYINQDQYFRDALLIYFTDGYGELRIPRPKTYRNLWVVLGSEKQLSLAEPYGIVLPLSH